MYPKKFVLTFFGLMVASTTALAAQEQGSLNIGVFIRTGWFDDAFQDDDNLPIGVGGGAGVFVADNLELNVSGSFSSVTTIVIDVNDPTETATGAV